MTSVNINAAVTACTYSYFYVVQIILHPTTVPKRYIQHFIFDARPRFLLCIKQGAIQFRNLKAIIVEQQTKEEKEEEISSWRAIGKELPGWNKNDLMTNLSRSQP